MYIVKHVWGEACMGLLVLLFCKWQRAGNFAHNQRLCSCMLKLSVDN